MSKAITLSTTQWQQAAERITRAAMPLATIIRSIDHDGLGESDAIDFENDMMMAATAMTFVAEFAADRCLFAAFRGDERP